MVADVFDAVSRVRIDEPEDDAVLRILVVETADVRSIAIRNRAVGADEQQYGGFRPCGCREWIRELAVQIRKLNGKERDQSGCQSANQHGRHCTSIRTLSAGLLRACSMAARPSDSP